MTAPPEVVAVTVALKLSPALTNLDPPDDAAAGLARNGLAVCWIPLTVKPPGLVTTALLEPLSAAELTLLLAHSVARPTSLKLNVNGALPLASKVIGTDVLAVTPLFGLRWTVVAVPPFRLIKLLPLQVAGSLHW